MKDTKRKKTLEILNVYVSSFNLLKPFANDYKFK